MLISDYSNKKNLRNPHINVLKRLRKNILDINFAKNDGVFQHKIPLCVWIAVNALGGHTIALHE